MTQFGQSLLSEIAATFNKRIKGDRKLKTIANRVRDGTSYEVANEYSVRVGEIMSESILEHTENLAYMSKEVAEEVIPPVMTAGHELVSEAAAIIQTNMNEADGVGLGVLTPDLDTNRIAGIVEKVASYDRFREAEWVLKEPMINYSQAIIDQAIRKNAESSAKVGLKSYVRRTSEYGACKWCRALEGVYEYPDVPRDVYRRHAFCRCTVTFERGKERQNVWNKREWTEAEAEEQTKKVSRAQAERELKAEKERRKKEYERVLIDEVGFNSVDENLFSKVTPELLDSNIDRLKTLENKYNVIHRSINPTFGYDGRKNYIAYVSRNMFNTANQDLYLCGKSFRQDVQSFIEDEIRGVKNGFNMPIDINDEYQLKTYSITHEYGHMIHNFLFQQHKLSGGLKSFDQFMSDCRKEIMDIAETENPGTKAIDYISRYGKTNSREFFAECFANSQGSTPNALGKAISIWLERQAF